jgi:hypothetical protein
MDLLKGRFLDSQPLFLHLDLYLSIAAVHWGGWGLAFVDWEE